MEPLVNSLETVVKAMAVDEIPGSEAMEKKGARIETAAMPPF